VSQLLDWREIYRASHPVSDNSPALAAMVTAAASDLDTAARCQADWRDRDRFPISEAMIELHNVSLRDFSDPRSDVWVCPW
jgi:hypothetical protein